MFFISPPFEVASIGVPGATLTAYSFNLDDIISGTLYISPLSGLFAHFDADYDGESFLIHTQNYPSFEVAVDALLADSRNMEVQS